MHINTPALPRACEHHMEAYDTRSVSFNIAPARGFTVTVTRRHLCQELPRARRLWAITVPPGKSQRINKQVQAALEQPKSKHRELLQTSPGSCWRQRALTGPSISAGGRGLRSGSGLHGCLQSFCCRVSVAPP